MIVCKIFCFQRIDVVVDRLDPLHVRAEPRPAPEVERQVSWAEVRDIAVETLSLLGDGSQPSGSLSGT